MTNNSGPATATLGSAATTSAGEHESSSLNVFSSLEVGDGNLSSLRAWIKVLKQKHLEISGANFEHKIIIPKIASIIGRAMHRAVLTSGHLGQKYTQFSAEWRSSKVGDLGGRVAFWEFEQKLKTIVEEFPELNGQVVLWLTQEFVLQGTTPERLRKLGVKMINVFVPDSSPKGNALKNFARFKDMLTVHTWSENTLSHLRGQGLTAELMESPLAQAYFPIKEKTQAGADEVPVPNPEEVPSQWPEIVVKSSGTGLPFGRTQSLISELRKSGRSFSVHLPGRIYRGESDRWGRTSRQPGNQDRLSKFYQDLSHAKILISPPNENVGLVQALKNRGYDIKVYALPPNGEHEIENFKKGKELGVIEGLWGEGN